MHRQRLAGVVLFVAGLLGYVAGVFVAYPGRSLSLVAIMVGITLAGIAPPSSTGQTA